MVENRTVSGSTAKTVFEILWKEALESGPIDDPKRPEEIVEARGMKQVTDTAAIEKTVDEIIAQNPDKVADAKTNPKAIGWFVGQVMKASGGKASPQTVNALLKHKLGL
jgi:aspartyl-tRNA(Asn)/glutamyl-tRNA(Gln) amidotransferase subunit B